MFINTLAIRVNAGDAPSFATLLGRVRDAVTVAMANADIPFEKVAEAVGGGRDRSRNPVFQVAFQLLESLAAELTLPGLAVSRVPSVKDTTKFDLTLMLNTSPVGGLRAVIEYNTDLYDASTIDRMLEQYRVLLASIVNDPRQSVDAANMLPTGERQQVTAEWNRTDLSYPATARIHDCIRGQTARTPDAVALESGSRSMTFRQLDEASNRVAFRLREAGVKPGVGVGVCIERSPELVVALLAVLKAGGHYVPLAADYPAERLEFMCNDADLSVLLVTPGQVIPAGKARFIAVDEQLSAFADCPTDRQPDEASAESPAYVIYTSGSTGRPKGVVVPHRAVVNYVHWMHTAFPHDASDAVLQKAPVSFDASVWELYLPLFTGARMVLARAGGASDPAYLCDAIRTHRITSVQFVPSQLQVLTELGGLERCPALRRLFCGGEALPTELLARVAATLPTVELTNLYGPTETTVYSTFWTLDRSHPGGGAPIGRPIANTRVYVLDPAGAPTPIGVPGELHIAGDGVSLGYLGRTELTAERFVPDEFGSDRRARMYRTGDRVRWRADGVLEYLGRIDHQVKLRGHRIELGEVEAVLARHPDVATAAAIVREDVPGDKWLVAYIVPVAGAGVDAATLREHVRRSLPEIMVPAAVVAIDRLPLNANAKLDRAALPRPDASALAASTMPYLAPRTPLEVEIAAVWSTVLRMERVGANDDFFDLGGHSLAAMRVMARLGGRLPEGVTLGTILNARTVAGLAQAIEARSAAGITTRIVSRGTAGAAPLTHAQHLIWLFEQMTPGLATYHVPMVRRIRGAIDVVALRLAVERVVERHEVLRTSFREVDGAACQVVRASMPPRFDVVDLRSAGRTDADTEGARVLQRAAAEVFDLAAGPMLRATVVRLTDDDALLLLVTHHIAFDGASVGILMRELSAQYDAVRHGTTAELPGLPIQVSDYACWERDAAPERAAASLDYWRDALDGAPGTISLPTDHPRGAGPSGPGARHVTTFPPGLLNRIAALARAHDATPFMVLLAAFQLLLYRCSDQGDIVVGSPIAGRVRPEIQDLIGYFANTLALRARFDDDPTFLEHLTQVRQTCLAAYEHQDVPYEQVVLELRPRRPANDAGLFSVMLVLQDGDTATLRLGDAEVTAAPVDVGAAKFDLSLSLAETAGGLRVSAEYRADLFDAAVIKRLTATFEFLLEQIVEAPETIVSRMPLLTPAERRLVVDVWNATDVAYPADETLLDLLEAQASRSPSAVAVTSETASITYAELHSRAGALGNWLRAGGVGPGSLVGVCLERSIDLVVALVGVLKAGGSYVPLDPEYPVDRLAFMLEDAGVPVLVTQERLLASLPSRAGRTLVIDRDWGEVVGAPRAVDPKRARPEDPVYMIYTSGSTGRPKGAVLVNRGVVNYLAWCVDAYNVRTGGGSPVHTSIAFDLTVTSLWAPLVAGSAVHLLPDGGGVEALADALRHRPGYALVKLTPAHLDALRQLLEPRELSGSTRMFVVGGEQLLGETLRWWQQHAPDIVFVNEYGPTETVVGCCVEFVRGGRCVPGSVPIGRPIANTRLYVLDKHMQPMSIGIPGELYIGGAGVAREYLNRPKLTAERFVPNPFDADLTPRLYRSGDRARWLSDGTLEYLGRTDLQVKLRGVRIELGEIEIALAAHASVDAAVVLLREDRPGDARLVAYITAVAGMSPSESQLRHFLRSVLPDPMIPSAIMVLERHPCTPNGKVDRRALPAPTMASGDQGHLRVPPSNALEEVLAGVWADVLGASPVDVDQNFFDLGGHSLLAMQVVGRVSRVLRIPSALRTFFAHPTVREFAAALAASSEPGHAETAAAAFLRLRAMPREERERLRTARGRAAQPAAGFTPVATTGVEE
ncbi:MAG: amino acid adenylation domain-containing protein [Gemmatimonadales bacterium]